MAGVRRRSLALCCMCRLLHVPSSMHAELNDAFQTRDPAVRRTNLRRWRHAAWLAPLRARYKRLVAVADSDGVLDEGRMAALLQWAVNGGVALPVRPGTSGSVALMERRILAAHLAAACSTTADGCMDVKQASAAVETIYIQSHLYTVVASVSAPVSWRDRSYC